MQLKAIAAIASLLLTAFVAGCTTADGDCSGEAVAGDATVSGSASASGEGQQAATGDAQGFGSAGYSGGEAYAAGGCGPCGGEARAGPGYAEVSGGCMGCEGMASAGAASASASGDCMGCTGDASAEGGARSDSFAAAAGSGSGACFNGVYVATKDVAVYSFAGLVTGASPSDPSGDGPIAPTPIAKSDSFVLQNGTLALMFTSEFSGSGSGRIEVYGPDNSVVYHSADYYCAGAAGASGCTMQGGEGHTETVAPGTYTVHYLVAGAADVSLEVVATVLAGDGMVEVTPDPAESQAGSALDVLSLQAPLV